MNAMMGRREPTRGFRWVVLLALAAMTGCGGCGDDGGGGGGDDDDDDDEEIDAGPETLPDAGPAPACASVGTIDGPEDGVDVVVKRVLRSSPDAEARNRYYEVRFRPADLGDGLFADGDARPVGTGEGAVLVDACVDNRWFVHFPPPSPGGQGIADEQAATLGGSNDFASILETELETAFSSPGHRRLFRRLGEAGLGATPCGLCSVSAIVRDRAEQAALGFSIEQNQLRIGRLCEFKNAQDPYTAQGEDWFEDAVVGGGGAGPTPSEPTNILLFDSGMSASDAAAIGVVRAVARPPTIESTDGWDPTVHDPHGARMARLIRGIAPSSTARIHSFRVMDPRGRGTTHELASALDDAFFGGSQVPGPKVVNMSLAWPASLSRTRKLELVDSLSTTDEGVTACDVVEDASGWAVRHVLASIAGNHSGTPVFAAVGNRPGRPAQTTSLEATQHGTTLTDLSQDECLASVDGNPWMYPAEYGYLPSCSQPDFPYAEPTVIPIGATRIDDRLSITMRSVEPPPLSAPGEQVVVSDGDGKRALTGSSVATAAVTAVAARIQALASELEGVTIDAETLYGVLYATGVPVQGLEDDDARQLSGTAKPRIASFCRAAQLFEREPETCVKPALACLGSAIDRFQVDETAVDGCLITHCPALSEEWMVCDRPSPPFDLVDTSALSTAEQPEPDTRRTGQCPDECPFETALPSGQMGALGPTPEEGGCPACTLTVVPVAYVDYVDDETVAVKAAWVVHETGTTTLWEQLFAFPGPFPSMASFGARSYGHLDLAALQLVPAGNTFPPPSAGPVSVVTDLQDAQGFGFTDWSPMFLVPSP